ncbi:MAG: hypothetical protein V2A58_11600 [Planctomycetota bacterium]
MADVGEASFLDAGDAIEDDDLVPAREERDLLTAVGVDIAGNGARMESVCEHPDIDGLDPKGAAGVVVGAHMTFTCHDEIGERVAIQVVGEQPPSLFPGGERLLELEAAGGGEVPRRGVGRFLGEGDRG